MRIIEKLAVGRLARAAKAAKEVGGYIKRHPIKVGLGAAGVTGGALLAEGARQKATPAYRERLKAHQLETLGKRQRGLRERTKRIKRYSEMYEKRKRELTSSEKKASDGLAKARHAARSYVAKGQPEKAKSIIQRVSQASGQQVKLKKGGVAY